MDTLAGRIPLYTSEHILDELDRVLKQYFGLDAHKRKRILTTYRTHLIVREVPPVHLITQDPDDDIVAAVAIATQSFIVSFDKHLLESEDVDAVHPARLLFGR